MWSQFFDHFVHLTNFYDTAEAACGASWLAQDAIIPPGALLLIARASARMRMVLHLYSF